MMFFWVKSPCGLVDRCQGFGEACCFHLLQPEGTWRWRYHASLKLWLLPTSPHGNLTQKNIIRIVTAMKILNHTVTCFASDYKHQCIPSLYIRRVSLTVMISCLISWLLLFLPQQDTIGISTPTSYSFKTPFTVSSNAICMQEWTNLTRDILCLHSTLPLVSFLVGLSVMAVIVLWYEQYHWHLKGD
jgi:hypothetical protein